MRNNLALALACAMLAGCSTTWNHATKGQSGYNADWYECTKDSAAVQDPHRADAMRWQCMRTKGWTPS